MLSFSRTTLTLWCSYKVWNHIHHAQYYEKEKPAKKCF